MLFFNSNYAACKSYSFASRKVSKYFFQLRYSYWNLGMHARKFGSETWKCWWDPITETHLIHKTLDPQGGSRKLENLTHIINHIIWYPGTELNVATDTLKMDFQKIVLISLSPGDYENVHVLYAFMSMFASLTLLYLTAWKLLIFYYLKLLLLPSCYKSTNLFSTMQLLRNLYLREKAETSDIS